MREGRSAGRGPWWLALVVALGFGSLLADAAPPTQPPLASVRVTPDRWTLTAIGDTVTLTASTYDANGTPLSRVVFTWASSAPSVASLEASRDRARVTAVAAGTATVTATADGQSGSAAITVAPR